MSITNMKSKTDIKTTNPPILAEEPRGSYQGVGTFNLKIH